MTATGQTRERSQLVILLLLGALCVVPPFAIDMYLPAFAVIAAEFRIHTSEVSLSLSSYFVGFAIGQLLYGPVLDRFGRKLPLIVGVVAYIVFTLGCALAPNIRILIALRFLQALGGCGAQVGAIAMVRDFFPVKESAKIFSLLFLMIGLSPLLAPTTGSLIVGNLGWRWIFGVLAAVSLMVLGFVIALLPEGHQPDFSVSLSMGPILEGYWSIFRDAQFLTYTFAGAFSFAGLLGFVSGSPLIFMDGFRMGTQGFGIVFAVLVMGFIGGNQGNVFLLRRFSSRQIFFGALLIQVLIGSLFFVGARGSRLDLRTTMVLFFIFLSCIGFTYPNGAALALAPFSRDAGRASALMGFLQTGIGALVSMIIGLLGARAVLSMLSFTTVMALVILLAGRMLMGQPIENDDSETVLIH
jgi:MFS transporter, DHA1 family, multidrug resistance protein